MSIAPVQPLPPILTTEEVAEVFRCSKAAVERYVHVHGLVVGQIGKERRFRAEDVLDFVAARPSTVKTGSKR